jgi:hypothetical protein
LYHKRRPLSLLLPCDEPKANETVVGMRELTWQEVLFAAAVGLVLAYVAWYVAHRIRSPVGQNDDPAGAFVERFYFGPNPVRVIEMTKHEAAKEAVPDAAPPAAAVPPSRAQIAAAEVPKQARGAVDICLRHHMRRVEVGRGWRCRK